MLTQEESSKEGADASRKARRLPAIRKDVSLLGWERRSEGRSHGAGPALGWKGPKCHPSVWEQDRGPGPIQGLRRGT